MTTIKFWAIIFLIISVCIIGKMVYNNGVAKGVDIGRTEMAEHIISMLDIPCNELLREKVFANER